jgi:hypothetical protein
MNRERILELADRIEAAPHKLRYDEDAGCSRKPTSFNMRIWHCGTVACIGGWAEALYKEPADFALGLGGQTMTALFFPESEFIPEHQRIQHKDVTPQIAARCLRNLAKTGKVDWKKALA